MLKTLNTMPSALVNTQQIELLMFCILTFVLKPLTFCFCLGLIGFLFVLVCSFTLNPLLPDLPSYSVTSMVLFYCLSPGIWTYFLIFSIAQFNPSPLLSDYRDSRLKMPLELPKESRKYLNSSFLKRGGKGGDIL